MAMKKCLPAIQRTLIESYLKSQGVTDPQAMNNHLILISETKKANPRFNPLISYRVNPSEPNASLPLMG